MSKKLEADFRINIIEVSNRVENFPCISRLMKSQIDEISQFKHPPQREQVNPIIDHLDCFCYKCRKLLDELNCILERIQNSYFKNKEALLTRLIRANDAYSFRSIESELFLANYLIRHGFEILEYEPICNKNKRADFKIILGSTNVILELITPNPPEYDFVEQEKILSRKLMRVRSGLSIEISGFELYDRTKSWREKVDPPSLNQIEQMVVTFRKSAKNIADEELPKELIPCPDYPKIKMIVHNKIPNNENTQIISHASRSGEAFPLGRIINKILSEREHLSVNDFNFIFVDFSYWNRPWFDLHNPFRNIIVESLKKNSSSRIDGVFSYIANNNGDEKLINRGTLYLNPIKPFVIQNDVQKFFRIWEQGL